MKTLCLRRFRLCLGLTLPPTGLSAATLIWKSAASGNLAERGWGADQPQHVNPSNNLVHCGRAAAGRADPAALRAEARAALQPAPGRSRA